MNHADVQTYLADYLEGDLALEDRALVDAHLDGCDVCAREVAEMQQTIRLLRTLPEPETPPMIAANVMRRIRAGESRPGFFTRFGRGLAAALEPSFVLPASAVAAAALVVIVLQDPSGPGLGKLFSPEAGPAVVTTQIAVTAPDLTARDDGSARRAAARPAARDAVSPFPLENFAVDRFTGSVLAAGPPPTFVREVRRRPSGRSASPVPSLTRTVPGALPVAGPVSPQVVRRSLDAMRAASSLADTGAGPISSGGEDPRDAWLALGLQRPAEFATFLAGKNLAEQELWIARLGDRAAVRGLLDELVQALVDTGDAAAGVLAEDLRATAPRRESEVRARR